MTHHYNSQSHCVFTVRRLKAQSIPSKRMERGSLIKRVRLCSSHDSIRFLAMNNKNYQKPKQQILK